ISTIVATCRSSNLETGMISRTRRLELFDFYVLEKRCPICNNWPRAERPRRREEIDVIPINGGICGRCTMAFVKNISVQCDSQEELAGLQHARREERSRGLYRLPSQVLRDIRSKRRSIRPSGAIAR